MIFLDTNILIDLTDGEGPAVMWSRTTLARMPRMRMLTNHVVLSEFGVGYNGLDPMLASIAVIGVEILALDAAAAFAASEAFRLYRRRGGPRTSMIPDFLIGAHAATLGIPLLTRDPRRFASYFPDLALISPETHP